VKEIISTKLIWNDAKNVKPKIDKQVLVRIESYYENDLRGSGLFRIGFWQRDPDGRESWYYLGRGEANPDEMGYTFKAICWSYLPDTMEVYDNIKKSRFELLDIR